MKTSLTPAEKSELESYRSPAPQPPAPPVQRETVIEPPLADVLSRASCNGHDVERARDEVLKLITTKRQKISLLYPLAAKKIEAERIVITEASERYHAAITAAFEVVSALETLLVDRAATLQTASADSALLAEAQAALESGDSLELSGEQLMILEQRRKHLPAKIAAAEKTALEIELQIQKLSTANEISVPALVNEIIRQTKNADGKIVDSALFSLVRFLPVPQQPIP